MRIKYVCKTCGAENQVVLNGTCSWDYPGQEWVADDISTFERPFCVADGCFSEDIDEVTMEVGTA